MMKKTVAYILFFSWIIVGVVESTLAQSWTTFRNRDAIEEDEILPESSWILLNDVDGQRIVTIEDNMDCSFQRIVNSKMNNIEIRYGNFRNCRFENVDLRQAIFINCDFSNAVFDNILFDLYSTFENCIFDDAVILSFDRGPYVVFPASFSDLSRTLNFKEPDLYGEFTAVNCKNSSHILFHGLILKGKYYNLDVVQLKETLNSKLRRYTDMRVYNGVGFENYDFSDSFISNCHFKSVDFSNAKFENAILENACFNDCKITYEQVKTTWNYKNNRMESLLFPEEVQARLNLESLHNE